MPPTNERVPNRPLSGVELAQIIQKDCADLLARDGMFTNNMGYPRVAYEIRISLHVNNPIYPEHVSTRISKPASKQQIEANPGLAAIEHPPLAEPLESDVVSATETAREIKSPNAARVEHDMPLKTIFNHEEKEIIYTGDKPDPASVGNTSKIEDVSDNQASTWGRGGKGKGKGKAK